MSASIKKKSKPKSDKVATNNNKQQQTTNNKRPFFLPKINKVFLRPILQNLKGRSVLDKFFFENDPLDEPNQMPPSKKFYLLSKLVKNAKWWSKSSLPLSHSTAKFFPLKKGFKKCLGVLLPRLMTLNYNIRTHTLIHSFLNICYLSVVIQNEGPGHSTVSRPGYRHPPGTS